MNLIFMLLIVFIHDIYAQNSWIRINEAVYNRESVKVAVSGSKKVASINAFEIVDILTNETVSLGRNIQVYDAYAWFKRISRLDFSVFSEKGTFFIRAGNIRSPNFIIQNNTYKNAADFFLKYMPQQRCGYNSFQQDSCHAYDGFVVDHGELGSTHLDVTGVWHYASDYLQYVTTSVNATYQMLFAYEENPGSFSDEYDKGGDPGTKGIPHYLSSTNVPEKDDPFQGFVLSYGGIVRGDTTSPEIHLVFTGGDYSDGGMHIRKTLKRHGIPAHFFFTGDFYRNRANKKLIKGLIKDGHYLGAHSDKHLLYAPWHDRDSLLVTREEFIDDLQNNYEEMAKFGIAKEKALLFMPPYEWYNTTISKWSKEFGLTLINFTSGTSSNADYTTPDMGEKYLDSEKIFHNIMKYERDSDTGLNGFILLVHIGTHPDRTDKFYHKLDELIAGLQKRGYRFTTMRLW